MYIIYSKNHRFGCIHFKILKKYDLTNNNLVPCECNKIEKNDYHYILFQNNLM